MYVETIAEWTARQACESIATTDGTLFANGATVSPTGHALDPPSEPVKLAQAQLRFLLENLRRAEDRFNGIKEYISAQSRWHALGSGPSADPRALDDLQTLQRDILFLRSEITTKQAELKSLGHGRGPQEALNDQHARQTVAQETMSRAAAITI